MSANPQDITAKALQFVALASTFGKRASDALAAHELKEKKAAELRPSILQHLLANGMIAEHQKEAAARLLESHEGTLQLLKNAADRIVSLNSRTKQASDLGSGVEDPEASAAGFDPNWSLKTPFVGVPTSQKKASDLAMLRGLGLE